MKNEITGMKLRLIVMNFLQFAVWGAYLTSMGSYLYNIGLGAKIGLFYAMQGVVSLFMPAVMGIIADRWVPAQKLFGFCHFMAALFMIAAGWYGYVDGEAMDFGTLFTFYSLSVAFYMPTLALTNSVAYTALDKVKLDPVIAFPPIRIFGTIGFICSMLLTDVLGFQTNYMQFFSCACFGVILAAYSLTLPGCPVSRGGEKKSLVDAMGLRAFTLFKQKKMAIFFYILYVAGRIFADNERVCQSISQQLQGNSRICRYIWGKSCQCVDFTVSGIRDLMYFADSVCTETFRNQACNADRHAGMGASFRTVRTG